VNTKDLWTITATIQDEPRRTLWSKVFPGAVVPIEDASPYQINGPGDQKQMAYLLDMKAISRAQREQLIRLLSMLWDMPPGEVRAEIHGGVAIEAEGVTVMVSAAGYLPATQVGSEMSYPIIPFDGSMKR
jgi:hypothetical protein